MIKGMLKAMLILMDSDHVSDAWPVCRLGNDDDRCPCETCYFWMEFRLMREALRQIAERLT